jgi:hypothetical protein
MSRPAIIPPGSWPRRMCAAVAAWCWGGSNDEIPPTAPANVGQWHRNLTIPRLCNWPTFPCSRRQSMRRPLWDSRNRKPADLFGPDGLGTFS